MDKFPQCQTCVNRLYDQGKCKGCVRASNYVYEGDEDDLDVEEITLAELKEMFQEEDE